MLYGKLYRGFESLSLRKSSIKRRKEGAYIGDSSDWSLTNCSSEWTAILSEDSDYDKSELEEELNFNDGEDYLYEEGWENVGGDFGETTIIFEGEE